MAMNVKMVGPSDKRILVDFATGQTVALMVKDASVSVSDAQGAVLTAGGQGFPISVTTFS